MKSQKFITHSDKQTLELGQKFAKDLKPKDVVCLYGDLGAGKTTFVKGIAKGFGVEKTITSPTFVLVRQYDISNNKNGILRLYHLDLYRLEQTKDIQEIGFEEVLEDKNGVVLIEWAEKAINFLPAKRITLNFEYIDDIRRRIVIQKY